MPNWEFPGNSGCHLWIPKRYLFTFGSTIWIGKYCLAVPLTKINTGSAWQINSGRSGNIGTPDAKGIKIIGVPIEFVKPTNNTSSEMADMS